MNHADWAAKLEGANYEWVQEVLGLTFERAGREATKRDGHYYIEDRIAKPLRQFMANPGLQTAIEYLEQFPKGFHLFEKSKDPVEPFGKICIAIFRAATNCYDELKSRIIASEENSREDRETYIFYEFVYFFVHITLRQGSSILSSSQLEQLRSNLVPYAAQIAIDSRHGHWPQDLKRKLVAEFFNTFTQADVGYTKCTRLDFAPQHFSPGDRLLMALFETLASIVAELAADNPSDMTLLSILQVASSEWKKMQIDVLLRKLATL